MTATTSGHSSPRATVAWTGSAAVQGPRRHLSSMAVALIAAAAVAACGRQPPPESAPPVAAPPTPPKVTEEGGAYVLRYFAPTTGNLLVARKVSEVPEAARRQVIVSPDDPALHGAWLYVADLTEKNGDAYVVRAMNRFALEADAPRPAAAAVPTPAAGTAGGAAAAAVPRSEEVILYKTAWCGYCKKAAEYLTLKGVPFVAKDIERDPGARQDMLERAQRAGVAPSSLGGVPVLWIKGRVLSGFSRTAIDQALGG